MELHLDSHSLTVKLRGWERVWSIKGSLTAALEDVAGVSTEDPARSWRDLRIPGAYFPGVLRAGSYKTPRGWEFWYAARGRGYVTIELKQGRYCRWVLTPGDNKDWAERIGNAIGSGSRHG